MPRYVLGPGFGSVVYKSSPAPKYDLVPDVVSAGPEAIVLNYPPFDPNIEQAPTRTLAYLLPQGDSQPADAQSWIDSSYPYSESNAPISPIGEPAYILPSPVAPPGSYFGQIVLEFPD